MAESLDMKEQHPLPWFHHGWVWFVVLIPFSAVIFGIVMIVSANNQPDDLVVDNYYKAGKGINQRLEQDERAREIGARAALLELGQQGVVFEIRGSSPDASINLVLYHVSDSDKDLQLQLQPGGNGIFAAASPLLAEQLASTGVWYLEIQDQTSGWRLRRRIETPLESLELHP